ncbi:FkbM family methyltransferase [soil metagenome]
MTTETEPSPQVLEPRPVIPRFANKVMRFATRIKWAEPELRGLGAVVRQGDTAFDVGAAHGMYTVPLSHFVGPTGSVQSFEPHPRQQKQLRFLRGVLGARQITVIPAAVGDTLGEFTMRLPVKYGFPIYGHAHIAEGAATHPTPLRLWSTPVETIDHWCETNEISRVAFIKVDVEGFEPTVIAGASATIERDRPSLLLEIEDRHLARYGRGANEFADEIRARWPEYRMYTFVEESWVPTAQVDLGIRNYLFATDAAFARP